MANGIISYPGLTTPSMVASGDLFSGTIAAEEGAEDSLVAADSFERADEELRKIEEEAAQALSHIRQGNKTNGHSSNVRDLSSFLPEAREMASQIRRLVASYPLSKINPPMASAEGGNGAGKRLIRRGDGALQALPDRR